MNMVPGNKPAATAFDLTTLMNALSRRKDKESKAASSALRNLRDTQSAVNDLIFALELLLFLKSDDESGTPRRSTMPAAVMGACFSQAILLYIRATEGGSERRALKIKSKLSTEQQVLHNRLDTIRNKVIAHLDNDRSFGNKSFADQRLILVHSGGGQHRLQLADRRLVFQDELEGQIFELVEVALEVSKEEFGGREEDVAKLLSNLSKSDAQIGALIESHPFDAENFFLDEDQARAFLDHGYLGINLERAAISSRDWPDAK